MRIFKHSIIEDRFCFSEILSMTPPTSIDFVSYLVLFDVHFLSNSHILTLVLIKFKDIARSKAFCSVSVFLKSSANFILGVKIYIFKMPPTITKLFDQNLKKNLNRHSECLQYFVVQNTAAYCIRKI
jgi:hypothetical protein